jgi:hypothetical protein
MPRCVAFVFGIEALDDFEFQPIGIGGGFGFARERLLTAGAELYSYKHGTAKCADAQSVSYPLHNSRPFALR